MWPQEGWWSGGGELDEGGRSVRPLQPLYLLGYGASLAASTRLSTLSCSHSALIVVVVILLRNMGCISMPALATPLRPLVTHLAGLLGVLAAKYAESSLAAQQPDPVPSAVSAKTSSSSSSSGRAFPTVAAAAAAAKNAGAAPGATGPASSGCESRMMAFRRRRTSSAALTQPQAAAHANAAGQTKARRTSLPTLLANKCHAQVRACLVIFN